MSEEKMLPCPFCGGISPEMKGVSPHPSVTFTVVWCTDCHMQGPRATDESRAIHGWNALPRALRWTKEPPTKPGWYWARRHGNAWRPFLLEIQDCDLVAAQKILEWEWAGPIPEPKEK